VKLLGYKPVYLNTDDWTLRPVTHPEWVWKPNRIAKFTCRNGHTIMDEQCGCGIQIEISSSRMEALVKNAVDPINPVVVAVVQMMGDVLYNLDTMCALAERIYLWGIVRPRWLRSGDWYDLFDQLVTYYVNAYSIDKEPGWIRPANYDSVREAYDRAVKPAWEEFINGDNDNGTKTHQRSREA
jgi:hypothetical protein